VLTTCNKQSPATFNPEKFQPVELKAEEVSVQPVLSALLLWLLHHDIGPAGHCSTGFAAVAMTPFLIYVTAVRTVVRWLISALLSR
jgi:hypothetical protein